MKFGETDVTIKEYLGKLGAGVVVALSLLHKEEIFEGMYWYTETDDVLSFPEKIENEVGNIMESENKEDIIRYLRDNVPPYYDIIKSLGDIQ